MTGLDTNILLDLIVSSSEFHQKVTKGLEELSDGLCTTPTNIGECLRLLTHKKLFAKPMKLSAAVSILQSLLDSLQIRILEENPEWWKKDLLAVEATIPGIHGNEVFDARIALCFKEHQVKRLFTRDMGFHKYQFLKIINPLGLNQS
jgi:predicted nucleic acid-binding protein